MKGTNGGPSADLPASAPADRRPVRSFKDLIVWQRARTTAVRCIRLANQAPRQLGSEVVFRQIIAAACSICANIAEGYGRRGGAEYLRYLEIAYGSACESENWIDLIEASGLGSEADWGPVQSDLSQVQRMLLAIMGRLRNRPGRTSSVHETVEAYDPSS